MAEYERLQKEILEYVEREATGNRLGNDPAVAHGYVWLIRRKCGFTWPKRSEVSEKAESLAFVLCESDEWLNSSADAIVLRVLENLNQADQGISLEELLSKIGLTRTSY